MFHIYISVRVQKSKRKGAFQIKVALGTVHFHALQRCVKQFDRANTLDFYVHALQSTYRVAQADGS